jgi:hypothetical protein
VVGHVQGWFELAGGVDGEVDRSEDVRAWLAGFDPDGDVAFGMWFRVES